MIKLAKEFNNNKALETKFDYILAKAYKGMTRYSKAYGVLRCIKNPTKSEAMKINALIKECEAGMD